MTTIPQDSELLKHFGDLVSGQQDVFGQYRVYKRGAALAVAEIMTFGVHTVTQLLLTLGQNQTDWSAAYRLFSQQRFKAERGSAHLVQESLEHVEEDGLYVVAVDVTHVPRSSKNMEGVGWARHPRTPYFKRGIHRAQRYFASVLVDTARSRLHTCGPTVHAPGLHSQVEAPGDGSLYGMRGGGAQSGVAPA